MNQERHSNEQAGELTRRINSISMQISSEVKFLVNYKAVGNRMGLIPTWGSTQHGPSESLKILCEEVPHPTLAVTC